jgi:serine kinase of HPr protein (carbohydrate metabolism regulator)
MILHAGLLAQRIGGRWRGVLIQGPSGAGKSDLALRALDAGFALVADDRVQVFTSDGRLFGQAPPALAGLIEVRGLGVLRAPALALCEIALVARCAEVERTPDPQLVEICGVTRPMVNIQPLEASAPAKLSRALQHLGLGTERAYQHSPVARRLPRSGGDSR